MANEVVRTIRIRGVSEGVDELTAKLEKLRQAENAGAAAAEAAATATEKASQRRLSASGAVEKIIQRTDEAARATARFSRGVDVLQWGRDSGYFAKSEQAALSYTRALHGLQRELEAVGTKGAAISQVDLHSKLGLRMDAAPSARESAASRLKMAMIIAVDRLAQGRTQEAQVGLQAALPDVMPRMPRAIPGNGRSARHG